MPSPVLERSSLGDRKPFILLVEDDEGLRYVLRRSLEDAGFQVGAAGGHPGALQIMAGATPIDVVVADQHLGDGLDGNTVARLAIRNNPRTRVLIISGGDNTSGFEHFLKKPIETDDFVDEVRSILLS
jgi:CheY-like chemotaxis protein